jgi:hypothetical protein
VIANVFEELALTGPADSIDYYRALLEVIREHGLDAAYRPLLLTETLAAWINTPDPNTSQAFLHEHPELLGEDVPGMLGMLADPSGAPDPQIPIHRALLALAKGPAGVGRAYECLDDEQVLHTMVTAAITDRSVDRIEACAMIEGYVHGHVLTAAMHMALVGLLTEPSTPLPDGVTSHLRRLAAQVDTVERDHAIAEFNTIPASLGLETAAADEVRRALMLSGER